MKVDLMCQMGDDLLVVNAARCSFDKESDWVERTLTSDGKVKQQILGPKDCKLINYLAREKHVLPFRHPQATFRIHAPLFVLRQLDKHQVGFSTSEVSRRYVDADPEFYVPDAWRARPEGSVKQGSGEGEVHYPLFPWADFGSTGGYTDFLDICRAAYEALLDQGVCPEQARMVLPQAMYTTQVKTGSLLGWVQMIKLRTDAHAQKEIRDLANIIAGHIERLFPVSYKALMDN